MKSLLQSLPRDTTHLCVIAILYIFGISPVNAQQTSEQLNLLAEYSSELYGTNDIVVNGRKYLPEHYNANGNPYFISDEWKEGILIIDGKKYDKQELLYNVNINKVILRTTIDDSTLVYLMLNNDFIDSFYLGSHYFLNAEKHGLGDEFPGFVEQVYSSGFTVLTQHQKFFISEYSRNKPNGFYASTKSTNYILASGQLEKIATKKSLLEYFSPHKKRVKSFMRKNKIKYKKANFIELNKLFEFCDEISSN